MQNTRHRTQILLEPDQHQALTEIARQEKRSISEVVREMLRQQLAERKKRNLETAASALLDDYLNDKDLTAFSVLDAEDFHA
ncbi:MAG: ribbon-helix-helix protein, CopG family [Anaerolineales bacterium]|nr:ribbon-helix-helix protein, CopG family [Anaerolineales bacterium]